ncbi:sensor histidine kinase [Actinotalea solisilvae]|uniref:sensor histidine kinase n=1 Tax=Actinotalea solisilvae TaxID=2072922 RepID=UPI003556F39D
MLERVVANLASNAAQHAPAAFPARVTAAVRGGSMVVAVVDRGPGLRGDEVERAFAAFERLGSTQGPPRAGLGLGLAVVRGLADTLGAHVAVLPTPGGGLTVEVTVPVAEPTLTERA